MNERGGIRQECALRFDLALTIDAVDHAELIKSYQDARRRFGAGLVLVYGHLLQRGGVAAISVRSNRVLLPVAETLKRYQERHPIHRLH